MSVVVLFLVLSFSDCVCKQQVSEFTHLFSITSGL